MQKGHKRGGRGIAVLHFFIGLIVVAILIGVAYFFLQKMDYSDKLKSPDASMRPYVEMTADPNAGAPAAAATSEAAATATAVVVDLTVTNTPEPTAVATPEPTPEPTPITTPTPTPEPTPTPSPTPQPTKIASKMLSAPKTSGFKVPAASENATVALTNFYVSEPNKNAVLQLNGYGYIDETTFDGSTAKIFLIVTQESSSRQIAYEAVMKAGISGVSHEDAVCANADATDFALCIDVSKYPDGIYDLGMILYYKIDENTAYSYHRFGESFTVKDGAVSDDAAGFGTGSGF